MSMSVVDTTAGLISTAPARMSAALPVTVEVAADFASAAATFEQAARVGVVTPYQSQSFLEGYFRHVDQAAGARAVLITLRDGTGEPLLLLPLAVTSRGPLKVARFIGGKHANFNMPVLGAGASRLDAATLTAALTEAGRKAGIDMFMLSSQPLEWEGVPNPLVALGGQASPSFGYKLALAADGEALLQGRLSKDTRKKLRQKEGKLAAMGTVSYRKATTAEEAQHILAAFFRLKAARFQSQGIDDPFAEPAVRRFLEEAAVTGLDQGRPTVELHALLLDERPVAIYGAVTDATRFCGLFTAFDPDPEISRSTPGDILLMAMIKDCCARGLKTFDLGVGEARYKAQVCDQTEALIDSFLPVTPLGRLAAGVTALATRLKRGIKQSPQGQKLIAMVRKLKARG